MKEMSGEMHAESEGEGKGATFVLKFNNSKDTNQSKAPATQ
jgi:hypothetical protein